VSKYAKSGVSGPTNSKHHVLFSFDGQFYFKYGCNQSYILSLSMFPKLVHLCILEVMDLIHGSIFFLVIPTARCSICYPGSSYRKLKLLAVIYWLTEKMWMSLQTSPWQGETSL
jgi:hypothetical protein